MVDIIATLLIFIEITLCNKIVSGFFVLSYLLYLAEKGEKKVIFPILLIIIIHSVQNSNFYYVFVIVLGIYFLYYIILQYLEYNKENIFVFSLVQGVILILIFGLKLNIISFLYNFLGLMGMNYFYIHLIKGKSGKLWKRLEKKVF